MTNRIMIVEDERIVALDLRQTLESFGHEVITVVSSGEQAIAQAQALHPDLILMDINLDGTMDGTAAAQAIHDSERIPVVFLTAYAEQEILDRAEASCPYGYLVKPVETRPAGGGAHGGRATPCRARGGENRGAPAPGR